MTVIRQWLTVAVGLVVCAGMALAATPPELLNYQGVLRDSDGAPRNGAHAMVFRLYDSDGSGSCVGGTLLLTDSHASVIVDDGLFNADIGGDSLTAGSAATLGEVFADNDPVYLEVEVEGETLCPRIHVVSAAYALNARFVRGSEIVPDGPMDLYVDDDTGDDANSGLSPLEAKESIQAAIDAIPLLVKDPVTVHIAPGFYVEQVFIDRPSIMPELSEAGIPIVLEGDTANPGNVTLTGASFYEFGIQIGFQAVVRVRGVRITGYVQAGIEVQTGGLLLLEDSIVTGNPSDGIYAFGETLVQNTTISNNLGFGIEVKSDLEIGGSSIDGNSHDGIFVRLGKARIENCSFSGNGSTGVQAEASSLATFHGTTSIMNHSTGVRAIDNSTVHFGSAAVTFSGNVFDMEAERHSSVIGYGASGICTADPHSICQSSP